MKKLSSNNTLPIKDNEMYLLLCIVVILAKYNIYNTIHKYLDFILKCTTLFFNSNRNYDGYNYLL